MYTKRGQITVFVIIGLLILIVIGSMIYFNQISDLKLVDPKNKEVVPIKLFVENCLTKTGKNALVKIGRQGGYYKVPDESITVLNERTPLYYSNLKSNLPSKKRIENELSWYYIFAWITSLYSINKDIN